MIILVLSGGLMRLLILIILLGLLSACGGDEQSSQQPQGQFMGQLDQQKIEVGVRCRSFSEDYFSFHSDASQMQDSNGDGIVLNGFQTGDKLAFDIKTDAGYWSSPNLKRFNKSANQATGEGPLFPEEGIGQVEVNFTVNCQ